MIESAEEFVRLRTSEYREEYLRAAHEEASIEVWREVIERYPDMRKWVAHNKSVPLEILEILSEDGDSRVRSMVATKRKLPEYLQLRLAQDSDSSVRERIAWNPKATVSALRFLADDNDPRVAARAKERLSQWTKR